jgi:hypothetical protein
MSTAVLTAVAWAYRNGARHIGHKSGFGVASGVFARCHRMAGNRVLMVSGTDEPQGLPEVDAPFASGESVVSFRRPSIAGGAQPLGQRTRPADAAPEPGAAPLRLTGSHSVRISFADGRHPPSCTRRETGAAPAGKSPPNPGRHDGGHPDVSAAGRVWDVPARTGAITELGERLVELGVEKVTRRVDLGLLADLVLPAGGGGLSVQPGM